MKNRYVKFAIGNALGAIAFIFLFQVVSVIFSIIALACAIKGLVDYKKDNSNGGRNLAIAAMMVSILIISLIIITPLFKLISPDISTKISKDISNIEEGKCEKLEKGSSSQTYCYGELAVKNKDVTLCDILGGDSKLYCIKKYAVSVNDYGLCLNIPSATTGNLAYLRTNCLLDIASQTQESSICDNIDGSEKYTDTQSSRDACLELVK